MTRIAGWILSIVASSWTGVVASTGAGAGAEPEAALDYAGRLAQLQEGDLSIDYAALRFAFAESDDYSGFGNEPKALTGKMFSAYREEDWSGALTAANALLDEYYLSMDAHLIAAMALERRGEPQRGRIHRAIALGLFDSICAGTDGRSREKPCRVISVSEEYAYLRVAGLRHTKQGLTSCGDVPCDSMDVVDRDGNEFTLYFDISVPMEHRNRMFGIGEDSRKKKKKRGRKR